MSNALVGFIISWRVPQIVPLGDLRAGIINAGLDPLDLAPDLRVASLVSRSAGFVAKQQTTKDQRRLARPVSHLERQITVEELDPKAQTLQYTKEASVGYDENAKRLTSDDPALDAQLVQVAKDITATRTASDVTRVIQRIVEAAGSDLIPVRAQGGAYFVPTGHDVIGQVNKVLTQIGGDLKTFACTVGHGTDESVSQTIEEYLISQIEELQEAVNELADGKPVRSDVKNRRLTRVAELKDKIGNYAALLTTGTDKLNAELMRAEETLLAKLGPDEEPVGEPASTTEAETTEPEAVTL